VIHRDIKPQNILLRSHHALVVDFGVAKALTDAAEDSSLTETGLALGTPMYMAPEQAMADPSIDEKADIYSLGVVAYEALSGRTPFSGGSLRALMAAHVTTQPVPLDRVNPAIPAPLSDVVMRCLEKEPSMRWGSAEELCEALNDMGARFTPSRSPQVAVSGDAVTPRSSRVIEPATPVADADDRASPRKNTRRRTLWTMSAFGIVAIVAIIFAAVRVRNARSEVPTSVAVMPFENLDPTRETDYFAAGLTRELATTLGKLDGLRVASLISSAAARERETDVRRIASRLSVTNLVEGGVRHTGTKTVVVTAQLTSGRTGYQLWSESFVDSTGNVLALQSKIARAIATSLVGRLVARRGHSLPDNVDVDPRVQDYVNRGKWLENDFDQNKLEEAINRYELALSIDSSYAPAHAAIASALYHLADDYYAPRKVYPRMREEALRAARLDSTSAEAYALLAAYEVSYGWNWNRAKFYLDKALRLDPHSAFVQMLQGWYLLIAGDVDGAIESALKASAIDPFSDEIGGNVVSLLRAAGRHDLASVKIREILANDVGNKGQYVSRLARESLALGNVELARAQLDSALALSSGCCARTRAFVLAAQGKRDSALTFIAKIEGLRKKQYYRADFIAEARAAIGDTAQAIRWLEIAYNDRSQSFPVFPYSVELKNYSADPRFRALENKLALPASVAKSR
jgi:serine/threonine-protein kinase